VQHAIGLQLGEGVEVRAAGDPRPVDRLQLGREHPHLRGDTPRITPGTPSVEGALEVPVRRHAERDALAFPVHHQPGRDRLHPTRRELRHDLLPQHRGDLVAVEPVEDPTCLLSLHQVEVEGARVLHRLLDRLLGDLVEHHPVHRHLGLELLLEVPGDRLALPVLVRGQVELGGLLEQPLELGHVRLLVAADHVVGREVVLHVHPEAGPLLTLDRGRHVGGVPRQVADVADRRLDDVAGPEVPGDRLRLGR
jgi:hypothetical protein